MATENCPCGKPQPYSECCEPFIQGRGNPSNPADLMRARYSAFVHHEIEFLKSSLTPARRNEFDANEIGEWSRKTDWAGLEIISTAKGGPEDETGEVEFKAKFRVGEEVKDHHELATFLKIGGKWYFDDGHTPSAKPIVNEGPKIGRNDPCHCGSGKKFKKCHGA